MIEINYSLYDKRNIKYDNTYFLFYIETFLIKDRVTIFIRIPFLAVWLIFRKKNGIEYCKVKVSASNFRGS